MLNKINANYHGGNIIIDKQEGNKIYLQQDLRSTPEHWFYYSFRVENATAGEYEFIFNNGDVIGPAGPAISNDGVHWTFLNDRIDNKGFKYTFKESEDVYFAFCPYYGIELMEEFLAVNPLIDKTILCKSKLGRDVPLLRMGKMTKPTIIFASRHHSCESPGTYALFGAIKSLSQNEYFMKNYSLLAVPFMDMDGVVDGDQGKNRFPHDHNRDYIKEIYPEVEAIKKIATITQPIIYIDFHAPWYYGGRNDTVFMVLHDGEFELRQNRFGEILENVHASKNCPLTYNKENNIPFGIEWNKPSVEKDLQSSADWYWHHNTELAFTLEVTYTGIEYGVATPENMDILGDSIGEAILEYLKDGNIII